jgi:Flp pilus assembly protein TadG
MNKTGSLEKIRSRPTFRWRSAAGQSVVELAITLPMILVLALGATDFGRVFYMSVGLHSAARAGAQYGSHSNITAGDLAGMATAAQQDGINIPGMTTTATNCTCLTPTPTVSACQTSYCTYNPQVSYVIVTTKATFNTVVSYLGLPFPSSLNLSATATMQVQP